MAYAIPGDALADAIASHGYWVGERAISALLLSRLRRQLLEKDAAQAFARAGMGRARAWHVDAAIRGDRICWIERATATERQLYDALEALRLALNRTLFLALVDFDAHFAIYPPGAGYVRHLDTLEDRGGKCRRAVSFVLYLNQDWHDSDGGALVLYRDDIEIARIAPRGGTLVLFSSAHVPHEVLPAARQRASIAGWFRQRAALSGVSPR